jgi:hypothetical protein
MRTEMLANLATIRNLSSTDLALASESLSAEGALARKISLARDLIRFGRVGRILRCAVGGSLGLMFWNVTEAASPSAAGPMMLFSAFSACAVALVLTVALLLAEEALLEPLGISPLTLHQLESISGTYLCQDALIYLERGGPQVAEWRDMAVTERGQLFRFDLGVMKALHDTYRDEQQRVEREAATQRRREELEATCRKVHGIEDIAP